MITKPTCRHCGAAMAATDVFCGECGRLVDTPATDHTTTLPPVPVTGPTIQLAGETPGALPPSPPSRSRLWLGLAVSGLAAAVLAILALVLLRDSGADAELDPDTAETTSVTAETTIPDSTTTDSPTDTSQADAIATPEIIVGAGPYSIGEPIVITVLDGEGGSLLVDGEETAAVAGGVARFEPTRAGTITLQVRVTSDSGQVVTSAPYTVRIDEPEPTTTEEVLPTEEVTTEDDSPPPTDPPIPVTTTFPLAPEIEWIDGRPMLLPPCDGQWITVVASVAADEVTGWFASHPTAEYLKTEITCESLRPRFVNGPDVDQPIYVIFYGPYATGTEAAQKCVDLGLMTADRCYAKPLTHDPADMTINMSAEDL